MPVFRRLRKEAPSGGENGLLARAAEPTHLKMTGPLLGGVKACKSALYLAPLVSFWVGIYSVVKRVWLTINAELRSVDIESILHSNVR